jgi:hypothetical protein
VFGGSQEYTPFPAFRRTLGSIEGVGRFRARSWFHIGPASIDSLGDGFSLSPPLEWRRLCSGDYRLANVRLIYSEEGVGEPPTTFPILAQAAEF